MHLLLALLTGLALAPTDDVLRMAGDLVSAGKPDSAIALLNRQQADLHEGGALVEEARVVHEIGLVLRRARRLPEAEATLARAASLAAAGRDTTLWCLSLLRQAQVADAQGRPPRSIPLYERVVELAEAGGVDWCMAMGHTYLARRELGAGDVASATRRLERAIQIFRDQNMDVEEAGALLFLGICRQQRGDFDGARASWQRALATARERGEVSLEGNCLSNLGMLEASRGRPDLAARHFEAAYQLLRSKDDLRAAIVPASNAAVAYKNLGRYADAERLLNEQVEIARRFGFVDREATARLQLGEIARDRFRPREAAGHYRATLRLLQGTEFTDIEADALKGLARALDDADSVATAIALVESALPALAPRLGLERRLIMDGELAQLRLHAGDPAGALERLRGVGMEARENDLIELELHVARLEATAYRSLGRPDSALARLERATQAWERVRTLPDDPEWREQRGGLGAAIHGALADLMLDHPAHLPQAERRRRTFEFLQRFKTRTLAERMLNPESESPSFEPAGIGIEDLQGRVLRAGELLLDFTVAPEQSLLFAITPDSFRVVRLPGLESRMRQQIEICAEILSTPPSPGDAVSYPAGAGGDAVSALSRSILGEIGDLITTAERIIFVPDGPLHRVPLRSLLVEFDRAGASGISPPDRGQALDGPEIVRAPSCAVLAILRDRALSSPGAPRVLAHAWLPGSSPDALRGAAREVRQLAGRYRNVDAHLGGAGGDAPLDARRLETFDVLHFAGHVAIDDERPWRSGVVAGPVSFDGGGVGDSTRAAGVSPADSVLHAGDIAGLELRALLTVLSGCESAGGRIISGEGVLGLATSFLAAGCPSVVATLWPVDDEITARFMGLFYRFLEDGRPVASALMSAQSALGEDPATAHPFYWAAFVVLGDGDVMVDLARRRGPGRFALMGAGALIALGALGLGWARRRRTPVAGEATTLYH